jgi:lipid-binding SYLF domain-containing protein
MQQRWPVLAVGLLALASAPVSAGLRELSTLEAAESVLKTVTTDPHKGVPPVVLREARGVVIIPHVVRVGLIVDERFGRGVLLTRRPDGGWSHPVFVALKGKGIGLEAGVEATDLVLVFRTDQGLEHILKGKGQVTLGNDVAIAAGPFGKELEGAAARRPKAEIFAYAHSRGLFAGAALEGDRVYADTQANEEFYHIRGCQPAHILGQTGRSTVAVVEHLKEQLTRLCPPPAPVIAVPVPAGAVHVVPPHR